MARSRGADCFLIDTSAASRIQQPGALERWASVLRQGRIGMCEATESELCYSARSADQFTRLRESLGSLYAWRGVPEDVWARVRELQQVLAAKGCHRSAGVVDLVVAVTAMHHGISVLHYDRDFETIAKHTDLKTSWVADPGTLS